MCLSMGKAVLKLQYVYMITCLSMEKVISKLRYVYIIVCSSMVKVVLKLRYVYVIMCSSIVKVISKAQNIQLFQLTLSDESLSLRDKTARQYGIFMPKFTKISSTLLAVQ